MNTESLEQSWVSNIWDSERRALEQYLPNGASFGVSQQTEVSGLTGVYIAPGTDMSEFWIKRTQFQGRIR